MLHTSRRNGTSLLLVRWIKGLTLQRLCGRGGYHLPERIRVAYICSWVGAGPTANVSEGDAGGAGSFLGWVPAPPERTECRIRWQALALFWNRRRLSWGLAPLKLEACSTQQGSLHQREGVPAPNDLGSALKAGRRRGKCPKHGKKEPASKVNGLGRQPCTINMCKPSWLGQERRLKKALTMKWGLISGRNVWRRRQTLWKQADRRGRGRQPQVQGFLGLRGDKQEYPTYRIFMDCSRTFSSSCFMRTTSCCIPAWLALEPVVLISRPISWMMKPSFLPG